MVGDVSHTLHGTDVSFHPYLGVRHVRFGECKASTRAQQREDRIESHAEVQVMQDAHTHDSVVMPAGGYAVCRFRVTHQNIGRIPDPVATHAGSVGTQFQGVQVTSGHGELSREHTRASSNLEASYSGPEPSRIDQKASAALGPLLPCCTRPAPNTFEIGINDQCSLASFGRVTCRGGVGLRSAKHECALRTHAAPWPDYTDAPWSKLLSMWAGYQPWALGDEPHEGVDLGRRGLGSCHRPIVAPEPRFSRRSGDYMAGRLRPTESRPRARFLLHDPG